MAPRRSKKSSDSSSSGPMTRSRSGSTPSKQLDVTYYTKVRNDDDSNGGFEVVSKRKLKSDPKNYQRLKDLKSKVDKWEEENGKPGSEKSGQNLMFLATHFNLFMYATCFFIQTGTLPVRCCSTLVSLFWLLNFQYLSKSLGADPVVFGQLQTAFAVAQLLGGPLYGRLGDVMGERIALVLAFASAASSYLLMGLANSIQMLFLSRLLSVLLHVMQGSQMVVAYLTEESERTSSLAKLGFSYGIGMVVGPSLGGFITKQYGEQEAALVAAAGSLVSLILVLAFIPNVPKPSTSKSSSVLNVKEILQLLFCPGVFLLLCLKLISGVPIGILQSMFSSEYHVLYATVKSV